MGIVQLPTLLAGEVGVFPQMKRMVTTDNFATITTAGYMNAVNLQSNPLGTNDILEVLYSYNEVTHSGTFGIFTITISNGVITLHAWANPGEVILPVVDGDFAVFSGTDGTLKDSSFSPSDATKTKVVMAGSAVVANRIAHFVDTAGTVDDTAAAVTNAGDIYAGLSGTAGVLRSYPVTATSGYLGLTGVANSGNFGVQVTNASHAQATVLTLNDIGASTGGIPVATAPFIMKQVAGAVVAGGAAAQVVSDAFCSSASNVIAVWNTSANAVSIQKVTPGNGSFTVTSSGDPGASTLNYIIMK